MVVSNSIVGGVYFLATLVALTTGFVLWRRRDQTATRPLSVGSFAAAVWACGLFVSTLPDATVAVWGIRLMYLGVGVGLAAMFVFALTYTGRERYVSRKLVAVLAVHPLLLAVFAIFNPGDLFFVGLDPTAPLGVDQQWGPAFWIHSVYGYLLVLVTSLLVVDLLVRSNRALYQGQAVSLAAGVFVPLPLNAVFLSGVVGFDTTPLGFVAMCGFFAIAIVKYRFVDLSPIARQKVIDNVRDGMIVVDTANRIIDCNPAASEMLHTEQSIIGRTVEEVLTLDESKAAYNELIATPESSEQTVKLGDIYYHIESTPINDARERHVGWLFLLQDVTEQKRHERELESQIEKLDQFASLVSHDLRSPINVANGFLEQTRETGDLEHLDRVDRATDRMEEIIDDVLELAREGQTVTDPQAVDVERVAREAWSHTKTVGASLEVDTEMEISADPSRLARLFENLFRNSVEHGSTSSRTQSGDSIEHGSTNSRPRADDSVEHNSTSNRVQPGDAVDYGTDGGAEGLTVTVGVDDETSTTATLFVSDDGVGIPSDQQQAVLEGGYSTNEEGTGLGLAIVAEIADAHGWEVSVTESETGGARFEIGPISKPW